MGGLSPISELNRPTMCDINAIVFSPLLLFYASDEGFESLYDEPY